MINDPFIINTEKKKTYLRKIFEKKKNSDDMIIKPSCT